MRYCYFHLITCIYKLIFRNQWQIFTIGVAKDPLSKILSRTFPKFGLKIFSPYLSGTYCCLDRVKILLEHYSFLSKRGLSELSLKSLKSPMLLAIFSSRSGRLFSFKLRSDVEDCREGEFILTLETENSCLYKICFTFCRVDGVPAVQVGFIEGPQVNHRLHSLKQKTPAFFGAQPTDLLFEALLQIGTLVGCINIYLVSNKNRILNFKKDNPEQQEFADYDRIWKAFGAKLNLTGFYEISVDARLNFIPKIILKKRSESQRRINLRMHIQKQIRQKFLDIVEGRNMCPSSDVNFRADKIFENKSVPDESRGV